MGGPGREGEGELGGGGVVRGSSELLDDGAEVGWVGLHERGVGSSRVGSVIQRLHVCSAFVVCLTLTQTQTHREWDS